MPTLQGTASAEREPRLLRLRQSFLNGSLTRLLDPEDILRKRIVAFVERGDFGLAYGLKGGGYKRLWWKQPVPPEEIAFDENTFLVLGSVAAKLAVSLKDAGAPSEASEKQEPTQEPLVLTPTSPGATPGVAPAVKIRLTGSTPPEQWNKLGTRLIPRMRSGGNQVELRLDAVTVSAEGLAHLESELKQAIQDLGLDGLIRIERL